MVDLDIEEEVYINDNNTQKKEKLVTATKKGSAVLDQWISDHIKSQYHVLQKVTPITTTNQLTLFDSTPLFIYVSFKHRVMKFTMLR